MYRDETRLEGFSRSFSPRPGLTAISSNFVNLVLTAYFVCGYRGQLEYTIATRVPKLYLSIHNRVCPLRGPSPRYGYRATTIKHTLSLSTTPFLLIPPPAPPRPATIHNNTGN